MTDNARPSSTVSPSEPATGRLFVISGPSGVGKGTIVRRLGERWPIRVSVSATTRPARPGEIDGVDYLFIDEATFLEWITENRFLEWAQFSGHYYGSPRGPVERRRADGYDVVLEIEVQGAMQVRAAVPDAVLIFIEPPSLAELETRLRERGDTRDVAARLETARQELQLADEFDHRVVNDELHVAVAEVLSILARREVPTNDQPAD